MAGKPNIKIDLIERNFQLGGLINSVEIDEINYDAGSFFLDYDNILFNSFPFIRKAFTIENKKIILIAPSNNYYEFPVTIRNYIKENGIIDLFRAFISLLYCKLIHKRRLNFISQIKYLTGDYIYKKSGLKNYIEKLFHNEDLDIDIEFYEKRLKYLDNLKFRNYYKYNLKKLFTRNESINEQKSLIRSSKQGYDKVFSQIEEHLSSLGVRIIFNSKINRIKKDNNKFIINNNGIVTMYDHIVSTIPIADISKYLFNDQENNIKSLKLFSLFYEFTGYIHSDANIIMNYSSAGDWKKITIFKQNPLNDKKIYLTVEGTLSPNEEKLNKKQILDLKVKNLRTILQK